MLEPRIIHLIPCATFISQAMNWPAFNYLIILFKLEFILSIGQVFYDYHMPKNILYERVRRAKKNFEGPVK